MHSIYKITAVSACEIGCTGILMDDLAKLEIDIKAINTSASAYLPWKLMDDLTKNTAEYQVVILTS